MSVSITYNILFEVRIMHHFFLNNGEKVYDTMSDGEKANMMLKYDVNDFFEIVPTEACRKTLNAFNCIFKRTSQGILVGLRAESDGMEPPKYKPFTPIPAELKFTFLVKLRDMNFINYTALPLTGNMGLIYSFQNIVAGSPKKFPALSTIPPLYSATTEYLPGDMVSDNLSIQTKLFTALQKTSNVTSTPGEWKTEESVENLPLQYVNGKDRCTLVRGIYSYRVKVSDVEPVATVKTATGITITPDIKILSGDFRTVQVDLRGFPEGFYTMHIESASPAYQDDVAFYLLQQKESLFAVIELNAKSDSPSYNMLDPMGFMMSPMYELRFRNRSTRWRYLGKKFNAASVTDTPLPLTRNGFIENVGVRGRDGSLIEDLPNPTVPMIKTEALVKTSEKNFYSEIHIN